MFSLKKLSSRVILLVLALEISSISIWGYATYISSRNELIKSLGSQLHQVALRMDSELQGFIDPVTYHIEAINDAVRGLNLSYQGMVPITNEVFKSRPEIDELSIIDANGMEKYRHGRLNAYSGVKYRDFSSNPLFLSAKKEGTSIGNIEFSEYYEPLLSMFYKLDAERGENFYIHITFNLKWIWTLAQRQEIGKMGFVYIVANDGKLISYPDHSLVLAGTQVKTKLPQQLFAQREPEMIIYPNLTGLQVAGTSHYNNKMKWWIIVELPTEEGLLPLSRMLHGFLIIFFSAAIFTIFVVIIFSHITMAPLENIIQAIAKISMGERGVQVEVKTSSELSMLADGINNMARRLDDRINQLLDSQAELIESKDRYVELNKNLEQRVQSATKDLKETNRKLIENAILAKEASQSKSMFLANTSHELRTPLNAILGYSELICEIAEENQDQQLVDDTKKIIYSARYLLELINNLLDLAKIEKGKLQLLPEELNLQDFIKSVQFIVTPLADKNNNELVVNCPPDIVTMITDLTRLRQIIINLLSNACKFTQNGLVELNIYLLTIKGVKFIHFCVSDNGIGMTPEQISNLFEVFQQADAKTTRRFGGSGLGLALSKQLALLMKGNILASSIYGQGSDFTLVLPLNYHDVESDYNAQNINPSSNDAKKSA